MWCIEIGFFHVNLVISKTNKRKIRSHFVNMKKIFLFFCFFLRLLYWKCWITRIKTTKIYFVFIWCDRCRSWNQFRIPPAIQQCWILFLIFLFFLFPFIISSSLALSYILNNITNGMYNYWYQYSSSKYVLKINKKKLLIEWALNIIAIWFDCS